MDSFVPGDINVQTFTVSSDRGSLDLSKSFVSASIYESIFTPGIVADITILDTDDQLGTLKLSGDESVTINIQTPGGVSANYKFGVHSLDGVNTVTSSLKSKTYVMKLVSEEALYAKNNYVQKSFNTQISEMIKTIHKDYLHSTKKLEVEDTKGSQKIVIPHYNPYKAIDMIRKRAVSSDNKSSLFVFFETRSGNDQVFKFTTIEKLFQGSSIKEFQQSDAINSSVNNKFDNQILCLEVPTQFNSTDRIAIGGEVSVSNFNMQTQQYETKKITPTFKDYKTGGDGEPNSSSITSKYRKSSGSASPKMMLIGEDTSARPNTHIPTYTADQEAYKAALTQNAVKMRVPGDLNIKAGDVITANIPNKVSTTENMKNDTMLSGKFLVSRIHHDIGLVGENPRYTCVIECIKGNPETGV
jgi:hypothetical protein